VSTLLSNAKGGAYSGHLMGLFTAIAFGSAYPIGKPIVAVVDPFVFSAARYLAAGGVLLLGLILFSRTGARVPWRDVPRLAVTGFLGFAVFQGLWGIALDLTTASKASVLVSTSPIFAAIIYAIQGHKLSVSAWLGVVVAFLGVFCVINNSLTDFTLGGGSLYGDALFVGIAGVWALYGALSRPLIAKLGAARSAAWAAFLGATMLLPLAIPGALAQDWAAVPPGLALNFAHVALIIGCLGMLTWNGGLQRLGLPRMTVWLYLTPVSAVILATSVLGEWLSVPQIIGAVLVLIGVGLTQR
jgi:drug/metabolite transporter (DMT)-like permease